MPHDRDHDRRRNPTDGHASEESRCIREDRPWECPTPEQLGLLVRGMLEPNERLLIERRVEACPRCRVELTKIVDETAAPAARRRRFPWVPFIAGGTVSIAVAIAWVLSGTARVGHELREPMHLLAFDEGTTVVRGETLVLSRPASVLGLRLAPGDRIRTPDGARAFLINARGVLLRYDPKGETRLARLGASGSFVDEGRDERLRQIDAAADAAAERAARSAGERRIPVGLAPRGNILSRRPSFRIADLGDGVDVRIEVREEQPRIRLRFDAKALSSGTAVAFPASGRPLERGRTFFWKASGMRDEVAFLVAPEEDMHEWTQYRETLRAAGLPEAARGALEVRYLLRHGFLLDALARVEALVAAHPRERWPLEQSALILDRLGRLVRARERLAEARTISPLSPLSPLSPPSP